MKLCIIGWEGHSYYILDGLKNLADLELTGIASGVPGSDPAYIFERLRDSGISTDGVPAYSDWRVMLDKVKPDVITADGPYHLHGEECLAAAGRGIHVFAEKPISLEPDELSKIENECRRTGAKICSMVGLRYDPAFYTAHKFAAAGAVGRIKLIHTQKSYRLGKRPAFYSDRKLYGGTIPWVGSHAIDWILWFTGSSFESVTAFHDSNDNFGNGTMEIAAECLFKLENGVIATSSIDFLRPSKAPTHGDDRIRIAGTEGVIEVRNGQVILIDREGERLIDPVPPKRSLFEDFIEGIRGAAPEPVNNAETFALTRACLLAREAADRNETIRFN